MAMKAAVEDVEDAVLCAKSSIQGATRFCMWKASEFLEEGWRKRLAKVLESAWFATAIAVMLFIDLSCALVSFVIEDTDALNPKYDHSGETVLEVVEALSLTILSLFLVEQALAIVALGRLFFGHVWHVLDLIVVSVSFVLELTGKFAAVELTVACLLLVRIWKAFSAMFHLLYFNHVLQMAQQPTAFENESEDSRGAQEDRAEQPLRSGGAFHGGGRRGALERSAEPRRRAGEIAA